MSEGDVYDRAYHEAQVARMFRDVREDLQYVGLSVDEAIALARRNSVDPSPFRVEGGAEHGPRLDVIGTPSVVTADYDDARLNFVVEDGIVVRAGFF